MLVFSRTTNLKKCIHLFILEQMLEGAINGRERGKSKIGFCQAKAKLRRLIKIV
jgi:hypothetical protein